MALTGDILSTVVLLVVSTLILIFVIRKFDLYENYKWPVAIVLIIELLNFFLRYILPGFDLLISLIVFVGLCLVLIKYAFALDWKRTFYIWLIWIISRQVVSAIIGVIVGLLMVVF